MTDRPLLEARNVVKHFTTRRLAERLLHRPGAVVHAVNGVSLALRRGETLGLIGESGCGKSTLARVLLNLVPPTSGEVLFDGADLAALPAGELSQLRARMQIVFQDPYSSLNPRKTVREIVTLPLRLHAKLDPAALATRAVEMLQRVGLRADDLGRYPHQFSGGQRQRISLARALITHPQLVVCDEPVSALDVSIKAQVLRLLQELRDQLALAYVLISHDIGAVAHLADRVAVMYLGRIVESGPTRSVLAVPKHPYTQALLAAAPRLAAHAPAAPRLSGEPPSPLALPAGCAFRARCPRALPQCATITPPTATVDDAGGHRVDCHLYP